MLCPWRLLSKWDILKQKAKRIFLTFDEKCFGKFGHFATLFRFLYCTVRRLNKNFRLSTVIIYVNTTLPPSPPPPKHTQTRTDRVCQHLSYDPVYQGVNYTSFSSLHSFPSHLLHVPSCSSRCRQGWLQFVLGELGTCGYFQFFLQ